METIRTNLSDAVNELNKLILETSDQSTIARLTSLREDVYFPLWKAVIIQTIDSRTQSYADAVSELKAVVSAVQQAKKNAARTAAAIAKAVSAAKAVDKIVNIGLKIFA